MAKAKANAKAKTAKKQTPKKKIATKAKRGAKAKTKQKPRGPTNRSSEPRLSFDRLERLGEVTAPSGKLVIFDIGLFPYLPREALEPSLVACAVPKGAIPVFGRRVGSGRFADCWDFIAARFTDHPIASSKKLGEAGVDFARLVIMDHGALDHWQHEDSLDGKADLMFWGRDASLLAKKTSAPGTKEGYGWRDLPIATATARWEELEKHKAANHWLLATDLRPHSHHFHALAAARKSKQGAGTITVGGAQLLLVFTSWGDGVFPIYLDRDADEQPIQLRIQLATPASLAAMRAVN